MRDTTTLENIGCADAGELNTNREHPELLEFGHQAVIKLLLNE